MANPDLDIRYMLPDLLIEQSGVFSDDGYDYVGDVPYLVLFLKADDAGKAIETILAVLETENLSGNDLRHGVVVAVDRGHGYEIAYPSEFSGPFPV